MGLAKNRAGVVRGWCYLDTTRLRPDDPTKPGAAPLPGCGRHCHPLWLGETASRIFSDWAMSRMMGWEGIVLQRTRDKDVGNGDISPEKQPAIE
jgi:hypothetical protein